VQIGISSLFNKVLETLEVHCLNFKIYRTLLKKPQIIICTAHYKYFQSNVGKAGICCHPFSNKIQQGAIESYKTYIELLQSKIFAVAMIFLRRGMGDQDF
jgi:hypothetical protein